MGGVIHRRRTVLMRRLSVVDTAIGRHRSASIELSFGKKWRLT